MSEFTTGVLYPRKYEPKVILTLPKAKQPYFHKRVNNDWNAFFLQDECIERAETLQFLLGLSAHYVPLLWFHDSEESGWGFRLFDGGLETTSATISYSLDMQLAECQFMSRHPEVEQIEDFWENEHLRQEYESILDQVVRSDPFKREVWKGISRFRPQCFGRFLSHKQVQQLGSLFDIQLLTEVEEETGGSILYDSVDLFKEIIGIEEMVWVNFAYLAGGRQE
ncbi:MAG: hypothetical protein ACM32O_20415 [Clostridia bacterium]